MKCQWKICFAKTKRHFEASLILLPLCGLLISAKIHFFNFSFSAKMHTIKWNWGKRHIRYFIYSNFMFILMLTKNYLCFCHPGPKLLIVATALTAAVFSWSKWWHQLRNPLQWWWVFSCGDGGKGAPSGDNVNGVTSSDNSKLSLGNGGKGSPHGNNVNGDTCHYGSNFSPMTMVTGRLQWQWWQGCIHSNGIMSTPHEDGSKGIPHDNGVHGALVMMVARALLMAIVAICSNGLKGTLVAMVSRVLLWQWQQVSSPSNEVKVATNGNSGKGATEGN